jgi:hypoxanthine phosphoribosyltransferase
MATVGYNYEQYLKDINTMAVWVQTWEEVQSDYIKWCPTTIVSIARGGLIPGVYLSHLLGIRNIPIVWQTRDGSIKESPPLISNDHQILIVDDINDSGQTFTEIMADIWLNNAQLSSDIIKRNVKTMSLFTRSSSNFDVDFSPNKLDNDFWIHFPWEKKLYA